MENTRLGIYSLLSFLVHYYVDFDKYFAILPSDIDKQKYLDYYNAKQVSRGFKYNSGENDDWVDEKQLRELIKRHVDPNFKPL